MGARAIKSFHPAMTAKKMPRHACSKIIFSPMLISADKRKIIFGHWSTLGLVQRNNVYAIDTGCLWGGQLTALRIDTEVPEITQVNSINSIKPI